MLSSSMFFIQTSSRNDPYQKVYFPTSEISIIIGFSTSNDLMKKKNCRAMPNHLGFSEFQMLFKLTNKNNQHNAVLSAIMKNEIMNFTGKWMELGKIFFFLIRGSQLQIFRCEYIFWRNSAETRKVKLYYCLYMEVQEKQKEKQWDASNTTKEM